MVYKHFRCILFKPPILWKVDRVGSNLTPKEADSLKGEAAENSGRAVVGIHWTSLSDISLTTPCQLKSVPGTTLPVISLPVCKAAIPPRSCDGDSAVKWKKTVELSNLMVNFSGQPILNTLAGFTDTEKSFIHSVENCDRQCVQNRLRTPRFSVIPWFVLRFICGGEFHYALCITSLRTSHRALLGTQPHV